MLEKEKAQAEKAQEIHEMKSQLHSTSRPTVAATEKVLFTPIKVLDHGFVRLIDYMGDDNAIVQAARVSYGQGTKKVSEDRGLIQYLMRHSHTTPFEMCEIKLHVKLPIFIARQWIRHRTASVNEYSARYSILSKEFYIPAPEQLATQSKLNHQGRGETLSAAEQMRVLSLLKMDADDCYTHYLEMLNHDEQGTIIDPEKQGIAREIARMNLNLNYYTEWYWKIDLHNLFHFIALRADSHAQYEIREYAKVIGDIVQQWVPLAYEAFLEYKVNGTYLSGKGLLLIKALLSGTKPTQEESGMSKREWVEVLAKFDLK
jgi:thymidylate synthase (FAD)